MVINDVCIEKPGFDPPEYEENKMMQSHHWQDFIFEDKCECEKEIEND